MVPWSQLTRTGVPQFLVSRRPLLVEGQTFEVGVLIPPNLFCTRTRLRQMYEQRRIEPVEAPKRTVRAVNEANQARVKIPTPAPNVSTQVTDAADPLMLLDLPTIELEEIEVEDAEARAVPRETQPETAPSPRRGAYQPRRGKPRKSANR
jgi:hypothetical protein